MLAVAGALRSQELAVNPPMGWNSWNHFAGKVTDAEVRATVDVLVS
jgi:alpha-galactosidase